ncbi:hypothetical protein Leryth_006971 [Lithospermum erythrorhizon]|nr:hypothetical protein Leryth_006971 [Lithospermum erythrorhizon]
MEKNDMDHSSGEAGKTESIVQEQNEMLYSCPSDVNRPSEKMGKVFALYIFNQYAKGVQIYIKRKYPTAIFTVANHGLASGLPRYADMLDQSSPIVPIPRPWRPDPICCARIEEGYIQHIQEIELSIARR